MKARFETDLGFFDVTLHMQRAPLTTGYFRKLISLGAFNGTSFYRIVGRDNAEIRPHHPIDVVQGGLRHTDAQPLEPVDHEPTSVTGLRHCQWTVSTARFAPGETYGSFFICMRNEPSLDEGGLRHPDGLGFAAFGSVTDGRATVEAIFRERGDQEMLLPGDAIRIRLCNLVADDR